jgi:hypothetical protein
MNIGQLLGGAGVVGQGMREAENAARVARQNQLVIEEQNRTADLQKRLAGLQMPAFQQVGAAQFGQQFQPGAAMPMGGMPTPVVPAAVSAAPVGGGQPLPPGMQPSQAGAGRGMINPPLVGQPQPMTPAEIQRKRDRIALLRAPTAALDVIQSPVAAGLNIFGLGVFGAQNVAGRVVNAITGEATLPTDKSSSKFSATPFYDRFVRQPEQALNARLGTPPAAAPAPAPAAAPAAGTPNKTALSYDNKNTPYDSLMQQSAAQYGIDPVIFKRLIGTESSFNPTAVSPRGEKFGLGIAQIAAVHGLTREQMLDPNTAIPFAAQLYAQELQKAGGNHEQALQKYKGASSAQGKASMAGPIGTILSGLTVSAQAAATGTPTAAAAATGAPQTLEVPKTQARNMEMAEFYLADPKSIPYEMQQINQMAQQQAALLTQQRNEAAQLASVYMQSGTAQGIQAATRLRETINQADAGLLQLRQQVQQKQMYLQGMQGLLEFAGANDPRRLSGVLSQIMGTPVGIQPRPDGNYNYFVNGVKTQDGMTPAQLGSMALKAFSSEARQTASASAALENELALKQKYGDAVVNAARDIQKAIVDGEYKVAAERAKKMGFEVKPIGDGSGKLAIVKDGIEFFVFDPNEPKKVETPFGDITLPSTARRVGLNVGR